MSNKSSGDDPNNNSDKTISAEPIRSRWTPKPEQILILESIFNSGMVNPPKDETVRIRKILERFGKVGDANVFYWFQNRRSRSRRRQRQMLAGIAMAGERGGLNCSSSSSYSSSGSGDGGGAGGYMSSSYGSCNGSVGCSSSDLVGDDNADDLFTISGQMRFSELGETSRVPTPNVHDEQQYSSSYYQFSGGTVTVIINGIPTEVPGGPFDMRAMFGNDVILVHSSGDVVPSTEYGILFHGLQMGESYFLVSKSS